MTFKLQKEYLEYENKSLRLPKVLTKQIQDLADSHNISFNKVIIKCIEFALNSMSEKNSEDCYESDMRK